MLVAARPVALNESVAVPPLTETSFSHVIANGRTCAMAKSLEEIVPPESTFGQLIYDELVDLAVTVLVIAYARLLSLGANVIQLVVSRNTNSPPTPSVALLVSTPNWLSETTRFTSGTSPLLATVIS